jgi:glutamate racemase
MRLGVVDWGIGGLATWQRLRAAMPQVDLVYFSDAGFTPYGKVPETLLHARLAAVVTALGVDAVVIACNAASTVLDHPLGCDALGIIQPGIRLALAGDATVIGVLGGDRTIAARLHRRALEHAGRTIIAVSGQPLSAHVEAGRLSGPLLAADLAPRVAALAPAQATLLACTHYPALLPALKAALPHMQWLDPVEQLVVDALVRWPDTQGQGADTFLTSGDPDAMRQAAMLVFGVRLGVIVRRAIG